MSHCSQCRRTLAATQTRVQAGQEKANIKATEREAVTKSLPVPESGNDGTLDRAANEVGKPFALRTSGARYTGLLVRAYFDLDPVTCRGVGMPLFHDQRVRVAAFPHLEGVRLH
jgi:hypothetical protein